MAKRALEQRWDVQRKAEAIAKLLQGFEVSSLSVKSIGIPTLAEYPRIGDLAKFYVKGGWPFEYREAVTDDGIIVGFEKLKGGNNGGTQ